MKGYAINLKQININKLIYYTQFFHRHLIKCEQAYICMYFLGQKGVPKKMSPAKLWRTPIQAVVQFLNSYYIMKI